MSEMETQFANEKSQVASELSKAPEVSQASEAFTNREQHQFTSPPKYNIISNYDEIATKKPHRCYFLGLTFLKHYFNTVEFQAIGNAVRNTLDAVNRISDSGLATIKKFKTGARSIVGGSQVLPKITVVLEKTEGFEEAYKRMERDRQINV